MQVFGEEYAALYDRIYLEKNYDAECDFLLKVLERHCAAPRPWWVMDFGCGTGNHDIRLAQKGLNVVGVDRAEAMLGRAREKAREKKVDALFLNAIPTDRKFSAVFSLFDVINYFPNKDACVGYLKSFASVLDEKGIVVFETWNGVAVPFVIEAKKTRSLPGTPATTRSSDNRLDWKNQVLEVNYTCVDDASGRVLLQESHPMKYYTVTELDEMAAQAGLVVKALYKGYSFESPELNDFKLLFVLGRAQ